MIRFLSRVKYFFKLLAYLNVDIFRSGAAHPHIKHLPTSLFSALTELLENKSLNKRLREGERQQLIIINGIPKSASKAISAVIEKANGTPRRYARYMLLDKTASNYDFSLEMLKDFPGPGVMRTHTSPSPKNLTVLRTLNLKQILLFRHPLDLIPAIYCSFKEKRPGQEPWFFDDLHPVDNRSFNPTAPLEEHLNQLMRSGYLLAILRWMGMWAAFSDEKQSLIVRYEDFVLDPEKQCREVFKFIGKDVSAVKFPTAGEFIRDTSQQPKDQVAIKDKYERGYTGQIAVWRKYFSADNKAVYDKIVTSCLEHTGYAEPLKKIYPNLLDTAEFEA